MKALIIGGTGLMGPHVAARLRSAGCEVKLFNRRGASSDGIPAIRGDRRDPGALKTAFEEFLPDVAIDMIPYTAEDAQGLLDAAQVCSPALVVVSSIDVYLAYGRLHRTEIGPILAGPITETSPLRAKLGRDGAHYDKLGVEQTLIRSGGRSLSILRLPMIYGPPDLSRIGGYVQRMHDKRQRIPIGVGYARWHTARACNKNCAEAIALCALAGRPGLSLYNVAEKRPYTEREWIEKIGHILEWKGRVIEIEDGKWPPPFGIDTRQDMIIDSLRIRAEIGFREVMEPDEALKEAVYWARNELSSGRWREAGDYSKEDAALSG